ncbi:MAG: class I SAM-dependent methyltransferase [Thermoleophilaceae bacterium]|nr:class I SAM-dependent methyltransferase [Thermoleophilaceae bacterium]
MAARESLSRRDLFGAGLGRLAGHYLDRLHGPSEEEAVESSPSEARDPDEARGAAWRRGDLRALARRLEPAAEQLVEVADVGSGDAVLDAGAGDGNVAVVAEGVGAAVTACDLSPAAVELGRQRTDSLDRPIEWRVAAVEDLPFEEGRFDAALSSFGAMYAPEPRRAMAELRRVVRPGGMVAMTAWTSSGPMGRLLRVPKRFGASTTPARRWGSWEGAYLHFTSFDDFEVNERSLRWSFEGTEAMVDEILGWPGPIGWTAGEDPARRATLHSELAQLVDGFGADSEVELEVAYTVITGRVPDHVEDSDDHVLSRAEHYHAARGGR